MVDTLEIEEKLEIEKNSEDFLITEILKKAPEIIEIIKSEINLSKTIYRNGIDTEFVIFLRSFLSNPSNFTTHLIDLLKPKIEFSLNLALRDYFKTKKEYIYKVYKTWENDLHYSIVLKEFSYENECEVYQFVFDYDKNFLSLLIPICFRNYPYEMKEEIDYFEEIELV